MPSMRPLVFVMAFTALASFVTPAYATSITDLYDPSDVFFADGAVACTGANPGHTAAGDTSSAATCSSLQYSHFLTPEFNPATHILNSATLALFFRDDDTGIPESYTLSLDGLSAGTQLITTGNGTTSSFTYDVKVQMELDGSLTVNFVRAGNNPNSDFYFERSTVSANYDLRTSSVSPVSAVPEPASMLLVGGGLAAIAARARRRKRTSVQ